MIIQTIVVNKPIIELPDDGEVPLWRNRYRGDSTVSNIIALPHSPLGPVFTVDSTFRPPKDQFEYNDWLNDVPLKVDDLITYNQIMINSKQVIHMIVDIQTDFSKLEFGPHHVPKCYHIVQVYADPHSQLGSWVRWDSYAGYRKLTQTEYLTYIKTQEEHDKIRDHCKQLARQQTSKK